MIKVGKQCDLLPFEQVRVISKGHDVNAVISKSENVNINIYCIIKLRGNCRKVSPRCLRPVIMASFASFL